MDDESFVVITVIVANFAIALLGAYISSQKNRGKTEGFLFGFFLSLLGLLIAVLMPTKEKSVDIDKVKKELTKEEKDIIKEDQKTNLKWFFFAMAIIFIVFYFYVQANS
tara:strand:+ start:516 stop:842 length:327 start_codon:yes stop_codon:yes gene_type:complete